MGNYQPTYLGELSLDEDTLTHYGVKGMKWRRKKATKNNPKKMTRSQKNNYYAQKIADDIMDGKSVYIGDRRVPGQPDRYGRKYVTGKPGMYSSTHETDYTRGSGANKYAKTDELMRAIAERTFRRRKKK